MNDTIALPEVTVHIAGARVSIPEATIVQEWLARAGLRPRPDGSTPRIGTRMPDGSTFMGVVLNEDGIEYRVYDVGEADAAMPFQAALDWAKSKGGDLPARREQSLLFANRAKGQFKEAWYWSKEQYAGGESYAWMQYFGDGGQSYGHKSSGYRARAVRRVPI